MWPIQKWQVLAMTVMTFSISLSSRNPGPAGRSIATPSHRTETFSPRYNHKHT